MAPIEIIYFNDDRYVWAKDLYKQLSLSAANYSKNVKAWFESEYVFQGKKDYSCPVAGYDYIPEGDFKVKVKSDSNQPQQAGELMSQIINSYRGKSLGNGSPSKLGRSSSENYLIRLELAKQIALDSNSAFKKEFVRWLLAIEAQYENMQLMSRKTILGLMEIVKACSYIDNQIEHYLNHKDQYFQDKEPEDRWNEFDKFRNSILQLLPSKDLSDRIEKLKGIRPKKSLSKVEKLAILDSLQSIRAALFDFLALQFRPYTYHNIMKARDLADFVKKMFEAAGVVQIDIKPKGFTPNGQLDFFRVISEIDTKLIADTLQELKPPM